ncbi:phosphate ABC transporter permease PstA [Permianibacter sp. IMCC34836]|uniref:phosphate ABC transporter permease PstA n=1 Tax=Permianibacter fluminis TaxID=2738515 RepID=UPI001551E2CD|nr:phosphate ABC transporter permease PstA [Permianibacter fluminis]NQD38470.1 phosphate ABC transporter permease PstA [Permianibacter fluminis]
MREPFFKSGEHWVWLNAGGIALALVMVLGLLLLIVVNGMSHFWPRDIAQLQIQQADSTEVVLGELVNNHVAVIEGVKVPQTLIRVGNRDIYGQDFRWVNDRAISSRELPAEAVAIERTEWGNFYGFVDAIKQGDELVASVASGNVMTELAQRLERAEQLRARIDALEKDTVGDINFALEKLRLEKRRYELHGGGSAERLAEIGAEESALKSQFEGLQTELGGIYQELNRDKLVLKLVNGDNRELALAKVVRLYQPNKMGLLDKFGHYARKVWEFLTAQPRESNTEGGVFPAIFGTVIMVMLMSVIVTPFGVVAAVYLSEYAKQGTVVRMIRIAVNNLAGVPSVVYGVFGLGFFVYFLGGSIDNAFFAEAKPAPTFGTSGLLWASLTLALLTLPVVIVSTEEGLARIPKAIREGSLALGATKIETLWRTVLPMASPAMMTGLILAVARAAGEVAPLMLVGVVKLAPTLPVDLNAPFLHLERKFMHLGFHIYDVGFQSPNVEAARPLVYASALLLVLVTILLNIAAIKIRNRLREKYKSLEH